MSLAVVRDHVLRRSERGAVRTLTLHCGRGYQLVDRDGRWDLFGSLPRRRSPGTNSNYVRIVCRCVLSTFLQAPE